ncbi:type I restriction endonuclease subunit R [Paracnuella aquatica]|uniref:type I restriction endonuclease subunit R n=1 Tax=Paracnuella aquatica TaxID=2268757 RepID=UPI000DEFB4EF|nr:type I restriction endonuclease subunit R [Paracnuella aquatica]RPD44038.1 type I restriction endonuclease subunit R [Paracnuella aquatica]
MDKYKIVAENPESTVVAEYSSPYKRETAYQTEDTLEKAFIQQLQTQAYEYLPIVSEAALITNLRQQLQRLNDYTFSDNEWNHFFRSKIANQNSGIEEKTTLIQEDHVQLLTRDDGTVKNIYLLDKANIHNNHLQVINQYEVADGQRPNRYDVTILVNGLPLVHVELKRRGVDIKEAFNQINRYNRESFWSGSGLFEYVQLFVISNGTYTKYYSNTTRSSHIKEQSQNGVKKNKQRTSNSYEFTSWWADAANRPITDLMDFARTFFAKHSLLNILTRYCVFTTDKLLLAMRPYQIVATERILSKMAVANNYKTYGTIDGGGYIWHTTGSGKTLTSFKTAQLASKLPFVEKVLFVVDRKDLDYQTMKEYDKFEKGAANSNTNTSILKKQLSDPKASIIITTIQKLSILIKKERAHAAFSQPIVIIFDECHRSQFGDMHTAITKAFKKYFLFGFTGTPIFAKNASSSNRPDLKTTEQAFGKKLHTYTIVDAINDKNVLPFRIDYIRTMKEQENIKDQKVWDIDRERALAAPERINNIVTYILGHFEQKTKRNSKSYSFTSLKNVYEVASAGDRNKVEEVKQKIRLSGFNSIFAVSSIDFAKTYYNEFKKQQATLPEISRLKIATIFSFGVNDDEDNGVIDDENSESTEQLSATDRDFLDAAIADYNVMFKTNYDTSADKFQNYYKDVSLRMKNREIDLLIVVNMFLTGFDATTLNTLWVDKNLRLHGLLQAYSRTNRILNSVKTFGNIVCFRNLEKATNESIALFGDKEAGGIVLLKTFDEYYNGYKDGAKTITGYVTLVNELTSKFPVGESIIGEKAQKEFIRLYGSILRAKNILTTFDEFTGREILSERDVQDYHSMYINLYHEFRSRSGGDAENVNDDIVFEMELIKQVEINIDYILELIKKYHEGNLKDKEIIISINKAIDSSIELRNKKDLIQKFIDSLTPGKNVDDNWQTFVDEKKKEELGQIIREENLDADETHKFITNAFRDGYVQTTGTSLAKILPPVSRFTPTGERTQKRETVIEKLKAFFNRFWDISRPE